MTDTLINIVLDKSGSMGSTRDATTEGINAFLADQAKLPGAVVSLTLFDTSARQEYLAKPIADVEPLDRKNYVPGGGTALNDAVMTSIIGTESLGVLPSKVLFVIVTDGQENASKESTTAQVKAAIERKLGEGWEFLYLGANVDAFAEAGKLGVRSFAGYAASDVGTRSMTDAVSRSTTAYRGGPAGQSIGSYLADDLDAKGNIRETIDAVVTNTGQDQALAGKGRTRGRRV